MSENLPSFKGKVIWELGDDMALVVPVGDRLDTRLEKSLKAIAEGRP